MRQTWRWFGPRDLCSIDDITQVGAVGVVSALHHVPNGVVWTPEEIAKRHAEIGTRKDGTPSGLTWDVVESLPVSEDIKKQKNAWREHIENYKISMRHLADSGIEVICYNFMPVLDWTRTDLRWTVPNGGSCMRFDINDFAAFDIHVLQRQGAATDYTNAIADEAERRFANMDDAARQQLARNVTMGLPGSTESMTLADVQAHLDEYGAITRDRLRANFVDFLDAVESPANGMTLCSGSLGARPDNDLPGMMERLGDKVHFLHLRNVKRDNDDIVGSFYEAEHLAGDTDMVALIAAIVREEKKRKAAGRKDHVIPMRPDHGQDILDDLGRRSQPGYPTIGRMKGLAELRGVMTALEHAGLGLV